MKKGFIIFFLLISIGAKSQSYRETYAKLNQPGNDSALFAFISSWYQNDPKDADVFIALFNYYLGKSEEEVIELTKDTTGHTGFVIADSNLKTTGMLISTIKYNDSLFNLSQSWIDKGIALHPGRLDLWFGKIYALGLKSDYSKQVSAIVKVIQNDSLYGHQWLWDGNELLLDTLLFRDAIQDYVGTLFQASEYPSVKKIARLMLRYYPNDVYSISNLGACYLVEGNWDEALKWFHQAEIFRSEDVVVINNMAYTYEMKSDYGNAINYYEKMKLLGNDEQKVMAEEKIKELKLKK